MSLDSIKTHMNEHHGENLKDLVLKFGAFETKNAILDNVTQDGLFIKADGKEVFAPFPQKVAESDYKDAIISLCMSVKSGAKNGTHSGSHGSQGHSHSGGNSSGETNKDDKISQEVNDFRNEFDSVLIASISPENMPHISYSPLLKHDGGFYLYISDVAAHTHNLRANPHKVQLMFIEDESKSKILVARKRLTFDVSVEFLGRDGLFDKVFDSFEKRVEELGTGGGVSTIRDMSDFHLVKIRFKNGRFVKGFGAAYNIDSSGNISHIGGDGGSNPHGNPHGSNPHSNPHQK